MAKLSVIERNKKRIKMATRQAPLRKELRAKAVDENLDWEERLAAQRKLQSLPHNGAPSRVQVRCSITGRARGVYKKFRLSRNKFRELALEGKIPGVVKASW